MAYTLCWRFVVHLSIYFSFNFAAFSFWPCVGFARSLTKLWSVLWLCGFGNVIANGWLDYSSNFKIEISY